MERILRSLFTIQSQPEEAECLANWLRFVEYKIGFDTPEDKYIHDYLHGFYEQMSAPPDFELVKNYFIKDDKIEVVARLDEISRNQFYVRTNFLALVKSEQEGQQKRKFVTALKEAITITDGGLNLEKSKEGKKVLKGLGDAVNYLFERASEFSSIEGGEKLEGVVSDDAEELLDEYELISKTNKFAGRNLFGLEPVDSVCRGHKAGEFWVHCAFAGELKCVSGRSRLFDHSTSTWTTVSDLWDQKRLPVVDALYKEGESFTLVRALAKHLQPNGVRPVFKVTTTSGRQALLTGNHKVYAARGWTEVSDLQIGESVAVAAYVSYPKVVKTASRSLEGLITGTNTESIRKMCSWAGKLPRLGDFYSLVGNESELALIQHDLTTVGFESHLDRAGGLSELSIHVHTVNYAERFLSQVMDKPIWDEVVSVVYDRDELTFDLEVPEHHSFVVDGLITHNTTLAINYAYNNAYVYGKNIFYSIHEMPYRQLRRMFYVLHSSHGKFITDWHEEDIRNGRQNPYMGLDYRKVRDGELDELELKRFKIVAQDFKTTCPGKLYLWRPEDEVSIADVRRKSEMFHNKYRCDGIVIDYLGLVKPKIRTVDHIVGLNSVVRDARLLALNFARGKTVPVLALFQLNRQGKLRADKADGRYDFAAISYANECLIEGTRVKTQFGMIPIEQVKPGVHRVWSTSGWKEVLNNFDNGAKETTVLKLKNGVQIQVTPSHRVRVLNGQVGWSEVKDLKTGDQVLLDSGYYPFSEAPPELPKIDYHKWERDANDDGIDLKVPDRLTDDLAYLMGALVSDGVLKCSQPVIGFYGDTNEGVLREEFNRCFEATFNQTIEHLNSPSRKPVFDIYECSQPLTRWFIEVGMDREPGVPEVVFRAPKSMVRKFLRGVFDTDGYINNQGIVGIKMKATHEATLQEVQLLLLSLGMNSTITSRKSFLNGKELHAVNLSIRSRKSRELFSELIGFTEPAKQDKLEEFVKLYRSSDKAGDFTKWDLRDFCTSLCDKYMGRYKFERKLNHSLKYTKGGVSSGAVESLVSSLRDVKEDSELDILRKYFEKSVPSVVVSVTPAGKGQVYDLEVTGDHEYSTGGVLSHNCEKSADVITYTYLNDALRQEAKFYLGCLKNRDNPIFDRMVGKVLWQSKRMRAIETGLLDLSADSILRTSNEIILTAEDMIT